MQEYFAKADILWPVLTFGNVFELGTGKVILGHGACLHWQEFLDFN